MKHWRHEKDAQGLAWLTFDKQGESTNTFSKDALHELDAALEDIRAGNPKGLIIRSAKDSFIAGADVEEFTRFQSPEEALAFVRLGWDVFAKLRALPFPTTALVNGYCMGGGFELALACRYRVALDDPKTRFAFPEVMLGIMPAWHGVQWLPKLIGPAAAMDLLLSGKAVDAKRAKRMGLVDQAVPLRIFENTARMVTLEAPAPRELGLMNKLMLGPLKGIVASQARKQVAKRARREHYPAPYAILELFRKYDGNALAVPSSDPASVPALLRSPTTANLLRVFKLQERLKSLGKEDGFKARHVHVIGAGTMGGDIAAWCALRGLTVSLQDQAAERLAPAMKRAAKLFSERLRDPRRARDARDRLVPDVAGDGVSRADVIIEAIFENLEAKRAVFAAVEKKAKPDAVLATNTSSIPLEEIAGALADPTRLVGIHFFNPVAKMMLVEVVVGASTRQSVAAQSAAFVRQIDKLPLPVKSAPGFLVNRLLAPYLMTAMRAVDEGIAPETVDEAAVAFGMPMGPIELADTVGLDICVEVGKLLGGATSPPKRLMALVEARNLGKKTGRGYYEWVDGKAKKNAPGAVPAGLAERLVGPYVAEARAALADHIVADADLVDAGAIFGTGFAPFRGGPLHYAAAGG